MAESFENLGNIFDDWAKGRVPKKSCRGIEQVREAGRGKIKPFLLESDPEIFSSSLSRQSGETKPSTKLLLESNCKPNRKSILYPTRTPAHNHGVSRIHSTVKCLRFVSKSPSLNAGTLEDRTGIRMCSCEIVKLHSCT